MLSLLDLRRGHFFFVSLALALTVTILAWSPRAHAQDSGKMAAANALFNEAKELGKQGKWAEACPKFKRSYELDRQLGTLLNLADCYDNMGRVATAWARWSDALDWAKRDNNQDRIVFAERRMKESEAKLPKVVVKVANPVESLTIKRGDVVLDAAMWDLEIPVDPGPIEVKILRGDNLLETLTAEAKLAEVTVVEVDLAEIERKHPAPVAVPKPDVLPPPTPPPPPPPKQEPYDPTHRNVGLILGAVGLAGVLAAAGLEIAALVKKGQAEEPDACVNKFCSQQGLDDAETAATFAEVGQWVGIGSLVVLAVGATIFFTAPSEEEGTADAAVLSPRIAPWLGPEGGGLTVGGRF